MPRSGKAATPSFREPGPGSRGLLARGLSPILFALFLLALPPGCASSPGSPSEAHGRGLANAEAPATRGTPTVGPSAGTLMVAGGGDLDPELWERFVELAGGPDARIVVIPTAGGDDDYPDDWSGLEGLRNAGASQLTILHTRDRLEANSIEFTEPLREASGVWFPGGRQWRLVDAYLNTLVHHELFYLLQRDGVVGGTSAGASIQASFLIRGDPETNQILYSPEYDQGFGMLREAAVDQHLFARGRENDLWELLEEHTELLGIGVDEGTALVIRGDIAEVIGRGQTLIYDPQPKVNGGWEIREALHLEAGDLFDLGLRQTLRRAVVTQESKGG